MDTSIKVAVTWLNDAQLAVMDHSERAGRNYGREPVGRARLGESGYETVVEAYLTSHGPLRVGDDIASHADIDAQGRRGTALGHKEVLRRIHRKWESQAVFEDFVLRLAEDAAYREHITGLLKLGL